MSYTDQELITLLDNLIATWENEVIEFKQADNNYKTSEIGEYFSALSNEANLRNIATAWLVFGVDNKSRAVIGTDYRPKADNLQSIKMQMAQMLEPSITFRNVFEVNYFGKRVIFFEIPAAPRGIPIAYNGHYYARAGESLVSLGLDKLDEIRRQNQNEDWTAQIVPEATLEHLDSIAVEKARESFAQKHANRIPEEDIFSWSLPTFLERINLMHDGKLNRAAILLLGKEESSFLLSPHPVRLTWKLIGEENAYEHFSQPFFLATSKLYANIRNVQLRFMPDNSLIPIEIAKYDRQIVFEALHNCIAHQDYKENARIIVTEHIDRLVFENVGVFYEGKPEDYILGEKMPYRYRNTCLTNAMAKLNMIDTMGYGIHKIYQGQAKRYFPLPDYDISEVSAVKLTIYGKIIDEKYTSKLIQATDLELRDILALDRIQKGLPLDDAVVAQLRKAKLIEGRKPHFRISAPVAAISDDRKAYLKKRPIDDELFCNYVESLIKDLKKVTRADIVSALLPKLSELPSEEHKMRKINNLITKMRRNNIIENKGTQRKPIWVLAKNSQGKALKN